MNLPKFLNCRQNWCCLIFLRIKKYNCQKDTQPLRQFPIFKEQNCHLTLVWLSGLSWCIYMDCTAQTDSHNFKQRLIHTFYYSFLFFGSILFLSDRLTWSRHNQNAVMFPFSKMQSRSHKALGRRREVEMLTWTFLCCWDLGPLFLTNMSHKLSWLRGLIILAQNHIATDKCSCTKAKNEW